jgi:hypothetical protein
MAPLDFVTWSQSYVRELQRLVRFANKNVLFT